MYTYINKKTGAVIQTDCLCNGENWELQKSSQPAEEKPRLKRRTKETEKK